MLLTSFKSEQAQDNKLNSITIRAIDGLKYDLVRFKVRPGERVKITLDNNSDMAHNLLVVKPGSRERIVSSALALAEKGPELDYIPKSGDLLWSIPLISPGQSKSVAFLAPQKEGTYPYVCTFPGHGYVMYGAMYVLSTGNLPPIKDDENLPISQREEDEINKDEKISSKPPPKIAIQKHQKDTTPSPHPYPLKPPYFYHAFIEGVDPAAVVVRLPNKLSYCWNSEACQMNLSWKGGFVDMSDLWKGHFNASAKILGDVYYTSTDQFPIEFAGLSSSQKKVEYMGYQLIDEYPEFHFKLNGIDVYELVKEKKEGNGLVVRFRIPNIKEEIWFVKNSKENTIEYESTKGIWEDKALRLSPEDARDFSVTMTSYYLAYKY